MHNEDKGTAGAASSLRTVLWRRLVGLLVRLIIPACILAVAAGFLKHQIDTRPQAQRMKPPRQARLVTVETVQAKDYPTRVTAMGTVRPAREITINPEVSGVITGIDPAVVPGGLIHAGDELFVIDARDYEATVWQRESEVARAELNLKLEAGNQTVAQAEYGLLGEVIADEDLELVLRKPHLANAKAALEAAVAALEKARLDVQRCTIRAPFNATILEKHVDCESVAYEPSASRCRHGRILDRGGCERRGARLAGHSQGGGAGWFHCAHLQSDGLGTGCAAAGSCVAPVR